MSAEETVDATALHQALVDTLIEKKCLTDKTVEAAFRAVPRHLFLPDKALEVVYQDDAIPTKHDDHGRSISSSSQPTMMSIMLEQLDIQPGQNVLEVGAGTGYNAALMGYLVGENGRITTMDIDEDITIAARKHLAAAGCQNVTVVCGDGMDGYAANGPYDRIILTVGGWEIAPAWQAQLKSNGRILLPLSLKGPQFSIAFDRQNGYLTSSSVRGCGFMRLRGPNAGPDKSFPISPDSKILIGYEDDPGKPRNLDAEKIYTWLSGPYLDQATAVQVTAREAWRSLLLWLAIHEPNFIDMSSSGDTVKAGVAPYLFGADGDNPWRMVIGILTDSGLAALIRPPDQAPGPETSPEKNGSFELYIRCYGAGNTAVRQLRHHLQNWVTAGRPNAENIRITAYPITTPLSGETAISRRWHTFVIDWPEDYP